MKIEPMTTCRVQNNVGNASCTKHCKQKKCKEKDVVEINRALLRTGAEWRPHVAPEVKKKQEKIVIF
jgi:putative ubiquitin-RnfH superfamily antitoxin RatB of RatAB toxin-antitoxin module